MNNVFADMHHLVRRGWRFSIGEQSISAFYGSTWRMYEQYSRSDVTAFQETLQFVVAHAMEAHQEIDEAMGKTPTESES